MEHEDATRTSAAGSGHGHPPGESVSGRGASAGSAVRSAEADCYGGVYQSGGMR